jgi:transcriptional regulator with GAF, ATPase, and Fis domain
LFQRVAPTLQTALEKLAGLRRNRPLNERLSQENEYLVAEVNTRYRFGEIVARAGPARAAAQVRRVAPTDATVLLQGETVPARSSLPGPYTTARRAGKALIKVNCAALRRSSSKASYSATRRRLHARIDPALGSSSWPTAAASSSMSGRAAPGAAGQAAAGLAGKEIERLGSNNILKVDVRIIAATNRQLEKEVGDGRFRADLYFRLNGIPLTLPPLRERREDLPLLSRYLLDKLARS